MRDQAIGQPDLSLALAEPSRHVRNRWIVGLTLASLGMWMATQTPLQVMLALQLQDITPRHKIVALGVVTGLGAVSSALATPVVGALSDRTAHSGRLGRFSGRRHRWTLGMSLLAAVTWWCWPSRTRYSAWPCCGFCSAPSRTASTPP